jgi:glycosyltransferase involved in cell wall biosynthesis
LRKKRVYIDVFYYKTALSGLKTYIEELVSASKTHGSDEIEYIFSHDLKKITNNQFFINSKFRIIRWIFQLRYLVWKQIILPLKLLSNSADVLICPDYVAPIFSPTRKIVVIHDNLFWKYPFNYPALWRKYFIKLIKLGVSNNCELVTTSKYSKNGLNKIFINKKITHVYQSSERVHYNDKINKSKDYILHIGTFEKRKDLLTLVKAFELFKDNTNSNLKLVLAGSKSFNGKKQVYKEIKRYILKRNLISFIIMPGYINKKQAIYYYNNAFAYVFPSIDEGFGIPLIEAMKARVPVLCSDIEIFKEIGDDSVIYFKKQDYNDLSNQLKLIYEDKIIVDRLVSKGTKRANLFTQKKFIKGFEKLY